MESDDLIPSSKSLTAWASESFLLISDIYKLDKFFWCYYFGCRL